MHPIDGYRGTSANTPPLGAYAVMMAAFFGGFGALLVRASRRKALPAQISAGDTVRLALATHSLSRLATRDRVTAALRFPFTEYEGEGGAGEVRERPRGTGLQRALGTLLTCQFCADPWAAAGLTAAFIAKPRETRVVATMLAIVAVSDFLHQTYALTRRSS